MPLYTASCFFTVSYTIIPGAGLMIAVCGLATLGKIMALSVSVKTRIPSVVLAAALVPIAVFAVVCSVLPAPCIERSAVPIVAAVPSSSLRLAHTPGSFRYFTL
ncbi:hypothetical protein [Chryseobacterium sp. CH1]|uniref:hypothetical protein n=1 Tax=Chryseobacterium sp. CH1 TaxID=713551 RepID=UPI0013E93EAE|nr:hypothetical protein [Chryseobacterium sp. CH1]